MASPSLESMDDEKYLAAFNPKFSLGLGLKIAFLNFFIAWRFVLYPSRTIFKPAEEYPKGPDVIMMSPVLAPPLDGILLLLVPNMETSITNSFPSFVSPPIICTLNSLDDLKNPLAKSLIIF